MTAIPAKTEMRECIMEVDNKCIAGAGASPAENGESNKLISIGICAISELCATTFLAFFALLVGQKAAPGSVQAGLCTGIVVIWLIVQFGPISGAHLNPAVSLGFLINGWGSWVLLFIYAFSQIVCACLGIGLLNVIIYDLDTELLAPKPLGATPLFEATVAECIATTVLMMAILAATDGPDPDSGDHQDNFDGIEPNSAKYSSQIVQATEKAMRGVSAPYIIGFMLAAIIFAFGGTTGVSMNPAISIAQALWSGHFSSLHVYLFGPLVGATLGTSFHRIFTKRMPSQASM
eukprot:272240_1